MTGMQKQSHLLLGLVLLASSFATAQEVVEVEPAEAVERHLSSDEPFMQWAEDPDLLDTESGDRLEQREVAVDDVEIVKLTNVVPPIRFDSGVADIPASYVGRLAGEVAGSESSTSLLVFLDLFIKLRQAHPIEGSPDLVPVHAGKPAE